MSINRLLSAALASAIVLAASAAPGWAEKKSVGVVLYARDSQFWQQIELGMKEAAKKYDLDLQFALSRRQLPTEAQVVEDLLTRKVDALVISPLDKTASATVVGRAKAQGIPIVEYNTFFADRSIARHSVGVDNKELAASVGREMAKAIAGESGEPTKIGLIPLPSINPGSPVRKAGMLSALADTRYSVVTEIEGASPEQGANAAENILRRDPATRIIWASNSGTLAGAASAVDRLGSKVDLYGIDMSEDLARAMLNPNGRIIAVSDQQPYQLGYLSITAAAMDLKGEQYPRDVEVPVKIYSRSNPEGLNEYMKLIRSLQN
jgi:ABC-type sugar transport system substrate-binding protein